MESPTSGSADEVRIVLDLGHTGDEALYLRVSPHAEDEITELMEAEGVYSGKALEFSVGPDLAIVVGSIAGGLGGLAAVLTAFYHRNRHKSIKFSSGDDTVELNGYSEEAAKDLFNDALQKAEARQLARDEQWRRVLNRSEPDSEN